MNLDDKIDYFVHYTDEEFIRRFRIEKNIVHLLVHTFERNLMPRNNRKNNLDPEYQVLVALDYFSSGSFQRVTGNSCRISQPAVSRIICRVARCIARLRPKFIGLPSQQETQIIKARFRNIANMPDIVACDGTHVPIRKPSQNAAAFRNRKGYFSVNTQITCDDRLQIRDIVCRWGGSTHDSRIFDNSNLHNICEQGQIHGIILGDNGYPCRRYLLTPVLRLMTQPEIRYNEAHVSTRNVVERCIGVLKSRFRCISCDSKMRLKLETTMTVVVAVCVLHNIALLTLREAQEAIFRQVPANARLAVGGQVNANGTRFRQNFIQQNF